MSADWLAAHFVAYKEREISNKVFQATLDSAPERNRSAQERGV